MGLDLDYNYGQTPIDEDEKLGLLIDSISSRGELDEFEQLNIEKAIEWIIHSNFDTDQILTEKFIKALHRRMFGEVWIWAGKFRKSDKNIGIDRFNIGMEVKKLLDDTKYWIENNTYDPDEMAIRFKHRLVSVHCFPNGNGRHSRIMADILVETIFGGEAFDWGFSNMVKPDETRKKYIAALREADKDNFAPLLSFART